MDTTLGRSIGDFNDHGRQDCAASGGVLTLDSVVSRKTHNAASDFYPPRVLDPPGSGTVEPRVKGPTKLIFTFSNDIVAADGTISNNEFETLNVTFCKRLDLGQ